MGRIGQDICAPGYATLGRVLAAVERWYSLTCQYQADWPIRLAHDHPPRFNHFVCVCWSQYDHARHCSQGRKMCDWLMRWTILPQADGIMGPYVNDGNFHHGAKSERG